MPRLRWSPGRGHLVNAAFSLESGASLKQRAARGRPPKTPSNLYISEPVRIRKVTADGIINTIAGSSEPGYSGDGGPATHAQLWNPTGLTVDAAGNVYVADSFNNVVRLLRPVR